MKWPLLFRLQPSDLSFAERAPFVIDNRARIAAPPERVFDELVELQNAGDWLEQYLSVDWRDPEKPLAERTLDETFTFMTLRIRNVEAERGRRAVSSVDASSIPLARQMLEVATFDAVDGGTEFRWRIHYDPLPITRPLRPMIQPFFDRFFRRSTERLCSFCERG